MPSQELMEAKRTALAHYGRLVLLAEDAAAGQRSRRLHSSLAGIGVSDDAVRVYVYEPATAQVDIVERFKGVPTRVVATPGFRPAPTTRHRPAPGGVSISLSYQRAAGTFDCLLENAAGDRYLLSNNHVIADLNSAPIGSPIIQPGTADGGFSPRDDIALLDAFQHIDFGGTNHIDAAVAALPDPSAVRPGALGLGPFVNPPVAAFVGQTVHKHGRSTAHTMGTVVDQSFHGFVDYGPGRSAWFEEQIIIQGDGPFSAAGDSGSLIVDNDRHPVALLFAGDDQLTLANPINEVLDAFSMTVA